MNKTPDTKQNRILLLWIAVGLVLMTVLSIWLLPWVLSLQEAESRLALQEQVARFGGWGWAFMLLLQILQIIVAVIPGEPIEIIMGLLYGSVGGFLTCELGVLIGSFLVFFVVRRLGTPLVRSMFGEDKLNSFSFLQDTRRLETITFILFFIPGTPKDILTYVAGLTTISPVRFLLIASVARIPSIFSSTFGGASIAGGNLWLAVGVFVVVGVVSLVGIRLNHLFMERQKKIRG